MLAFSFFLLYFKIGDKRFIYAAVPGCIGKMVT